METGIKNSKKRQHDTKCETPESKKQRTEKPQKEEKFLCGVHAFILQAGIEKMRMDIFKSQLQKFGGQLHGKILDTTTHLVVDDKMTAERMCKILKSDKPPENVVTVKSAWLSSCFKTKSFVSVENYKLDLSSLDKKPAETQAIPAKANDGVDKPDEGQKETKSEFPKVGVMFGAYKKSKRPEAALDSDSGADSDYMPSDGEEEPPSRGEAFEGPGTSSSSDTSTPNSSPFKNLPRGNWVCAQSSKNVKQNYNKHITDKLEEMVKTYESTNDKWRAFGYQKAIQVLKKQPKPVTTWEEAMSLPQVGKRLADKIWEIVESGELRKLNEFKSSEDVKILEMFTNVWGAGPTTARAWMQQGFKTLEDIKTKANLTHQQKVGLAHYDDLLDRMPRKEAGEIEQVVRECAESIQPGIIAQACGSYRRGRATCGDVDVLVTHPDGKSHKGIFAKLLAKLKNQGFLTDDLVTAEEDGNQKKYLGVCKLPGEDRKHRRLDIIVVPYDEYACALVYFTGSAHFNRSLRHLAKKMGMSLNEHALKTGVVRKGTEKIYEGTSLYTPTEESVFKQLGVPCRPPEERDH